MEDEENLAELSPCDSVHWLFLECDVSDPLDEDNENLSFLPWFRIEQ